VVSPFVTGSPRFSFTLFSWLKQEFRCWIVVSCLSRVTPPPPAKIFPGLMGLHPLALLQTYTPLCPPNAAICFVCPSYFAPHPPDGRNNTRVFLLHGPSLRLRSLSPSFAPFTSSQVVTRHTVFFFVVARCRAGPVQEINLQNH